MNLFRRLIGRRMRDTLGPAHSRTFQRCSYLVLVMQMQALRPPRHRAPKTGAPKGDLTSNESRLRKKAERRERRRAGTVLVWINRETEMADLAEIEPLLFALVGG